MLSTGWSAFQRYLDPPPGHEPTAGRDAFVIGLTAFGLRAVAAAGVWTYLAVTNNPWVQPDEGTYLREAGQVAAGRVDGYVHEYGRLLGYLFKVTGHHAFVARGLNVILGALLAVLAWHLARQVVSRTASVVTGLAVAAWPSLVLWSVLALRDALVAVLVLVALVGLVTARRGQWSGLVLAASGALGLTYLKPFAYVLVCGTAVVIAAAALAWSRTRQILVVTVALVVLLGAIGQVRHQGFLGVRYARGYGQTDVILALRAEGASAGETGFGSANPETVNPAAGAADLDPPSRAQENIDTELTEEPLAVQGAGDVVDGVAEGLLYGLLGPFPTQTSGAPQRVLLALELPLWYATLLLAGAALFRRGRGVLRAWLPVLIFVGGFAVVLATYSGNAGTAFRQRALIIPLVAAVAVSALYDFRRAPPRTSAVPEDDGLVLAEPYPVIHHRVAEPTRPAATG